MEDRLMDTNTEDYLEILYWEFDSEKKKFSFSERDLFKAKMRGLIRTIQNTSATDPLVDQLKAELNRLYTKTEEDRFAALADDSVPRLVFHAAIDAIANKDALLEEMARALEDALRVCEWGEPQPKPVAKRIESVLQKWEATCQQEKK